MIVITAKAGESLFIGDDIEIRLLQVRGPQVRVGIAAPADLEVASAKLRASRASKKKEEACVPSGA